MLELAETSDLATMRQGVNGAACELAELPLRRTTPLENLLATGFYVSDLTRERSQNAVAGAMQASTFGVGVTHSGGPSLGCPFEVLEMWARQVLFNREFAVPRIDFVVGRAIARWNPASEGQGAVLDALADEHAAVGRKVRDALNAIDGMQVQTLCDADVEAWPEYRDAQARRRSVNDQAHPYSKAQDNLFEANRLRGAGAKGGWSTVERSTDLVTGDKTERLQTGSVFAGGGCEAAFDTLSMAAFPEAGMHYFYGPAAATLAKSAPAGCPYTTKAIGGTQEHGRVLLRGDTDVAGLLTAFLDRAKKENGQTAGKRLAVVDRLLSTVKLLDAGFCRVDNHRTMRLGLEADHVQLNLKRDELIGMKSGAAVNDRRAAANKERLDLGFAKAEYLALRMGEYIRLFAVR